MTVLKWSTSKDIYDCFHELTSDILIQPILTTVHPFFHVHIGLLILGIAIRRNWNNYYNITDVPTTLHLSQMNPIFSSQEISFICSQLQLHNTSQWPHYLYLRQVGLLGASAHIYSENLQSHHTKCEIGLVSTDHVET